MPLTLQFTLVSAVPDTEAVSVIKFPSKTVLAGAVTLTEMEGGGGGGGATAPPPPQPSVHVPAVRRPRKPIRVFPRLVALFSGRGRMPPAKQAKGQRNKKRD